MEREELLEVLSNFKKELKVEMSNSTPPPTSQPTTTKHSELVGELMAALDQRNQADAQKVYDTMFEEKVSSLSSQYPAFGEYLNSKDDFGEVILDRIKEIKDYKQRVETFEKVFKRYASAQSSSSQDMRISKAVKKQVEDDVSQRDAIKDSFAKGEIGLQEFTDKFFGSVEQQINRLQGK